VWSGEGEGGVV